MSANLTMTDLFCGAGGSSTGAVTVPGVDLDEHVREMERRARESRKGGAV